MSADPQDRFELPPGQGMLARLRQRLPALRLPAVRLPLPGARGARSAVLVLVGSVAAYYGIGMAVTHHIDDDIEFNANATVDGLRSVDMAAALIHRETKVNSWVPNDPWFIPGAFLDNMRNFQLGEADALKRFTQAMRDKIGRQRGSSQIPPDLQTANSQMQVSADQWIFNHQDSFWKSLVPIISAENSYGQARESLLRYNAEVSASRQKLDARADNLIELLDYIASDLGAASAGLDSKVGLKPIQDAPKAGDQPVADRPNPVVAQSDDLFYYNKGLLYGNYLILNSIRHDFAKVIEGRDVAALYGNMLSTLAEAAQLQPLVVLNGDPESNFMPNHLTTQGFYMLRARIQLREVAAALASQK